MTDWLLLALGLLLIACAVVSHRRAKCRDRRPGFLYERNKDRIGL
jgi:hypothetical protein